MMNSLKNFNQVLFLLSALWLMWGGGDGREQGLPVGMETILPQGREAAPSSSQGAAICAVNKPQSFPKRGAAV